MVKIKIILFGRFMPFHWLSHIAAIVTDMSTNQTFKVHSPFPSDGHFIDKIENSMYERAQNSFAIGTVILYSNKNFAEFLRAYNKNRSDRQYSYLFNNCANHVDFVLDYFCPNNLHLVNLFGLYFLHSSILSILTFGCSLFSLSPLISTPRDVYNKAYSLSFFYNEQTARTSGEEPKLLTDGTPLISVTSVEDEAKGLDPVESLVNKFSLIH